jgi:hypothetical protein
MRSGSQKRTEADKKDNPAATTHITMTSARQAHRWRDKLNKVTSLSGDSLPSREGRGHKKEMPRSGS